MQEEEQRRSSSLQAPTMRLQGHQAAVYTVQFSPDGTTLASGSYDKNILLWEVQGDCRNYNVMSGHTNAILELRWDAEGKQIVSASADKTAALYDSYKGVRIRKYTGHEASVNGVSFARDKGVHLLATCSDDTTVRVWDTRNKRAVHVFQHEWQLLAVEMSPDGNMLYTGGIDNMIHVWDVNKGVEVDTYDGHQDTITGLAISPDRRSLLSNGMENLLRQWNIRPLVVERRNTKSYQGALHGSDRNLLRCSWSRDGEMITAGSSDRIVHIWDVPTGQCLYSLPGHQGTVNQVVFHPNEPVIASASSDKTIFLGELA